MVYDAYWRVGVWCLWDRNTWNTFQECIFQSVIEHKLTVYNIHIYSETVLQMNIRGISAGLLHICQRGQSESSPFGSDGSRDNQTWRLSHVSWPKATPGVLSGSSLIRSNGSCDGQAGRGTIVRWWPKTLKTKLNLKGDYQAWVHTGQMFSWY